jgi:predicted RNA-binding Zn ribbon-like protein
VGVVVRAAVRPGALHRQNDFHRNKRTNKVRIAGTLGGVQAIAEMPFIAGHLTLDFVNTAEERGHPEAGDALRTPADLRLWGRRHDLISRSGAGDVDERAELRRAREVREVLYALFFAQAHGRPPSKAQLAQLARFAASAYAAASLQPTDDGSTSWRWRRSELSTIRHVVVAGAIDLLRSDPSPRLKQCPGEHCGWFFLDTTKRGNRRWCSMSECGQEAKDERRRARRQAKGGSAYAASAPSGTSQ